MITITNDYHNTAATLRANIGDELTINQIRRAKTALCGIDGCSCGGPAGERGRQDGFVVEQVGCNRIVIIGDEK